MKPLEHWTRARVFVPGRTPIYAVEATHDGAFAAHDHEFVEIVLMLGGAARHITSAGGHALSPGDVLVLRPGVWHGYDDAKQLRIYNCCFGAELLDRELAWTLDDPIVGALLWGPRQAGGVIQLHVAPSVARRCAADLGTVRAPDVHAASVGKLLQFLGTLSACGSIAAPAIAPMVTRVVRQLEADLRRAWRVADLARLVGVDEAYLTRRFTASMGVPPMAYLARCRAERAAALLLQTRDDIADIATSVGWDDPVYFARRFKQHYAIPPREYRKRFGHAV